MGLFSAPDVQALADKKDVHALVEVLGYKRGSPQSEHVAVRRAAAKALAGSPSETALKALMVAMHEDVLDVAAQAADGLAACGKPAAIALCQDIDTEGPDELRKTSAVLVKLGAKAVGPLVARFGKTGEVGQDRILDALDQIDKAEVLGVLHRALIGSQPGRRRGAAEMLGQLGDGKSVAPLAKVLSRDEDRDVRQEAARALGRIGTADASAPLLRALSDESEEVRTAVSEAIEAVGEPAVQPLMDLAAGGPPQTRYLALSALADMGAPEAERLFVQHMEAESPALRLVAALGLIGCETFGARRALTTGLADEDAHVRLVAARALLASDAAGSDMAQAMEVERAAFATVCEPLRGDDPDQASMVVELLEELAQPQDARVLMDALGRKKLSSLHVRIMEALGKIGDPTPAGLLASRLAAKDRSVREAAAQALIEITDPVVVNRVLKALRGMTGSETKEALASSVLASFGIHAREPLIAALAGDPAVVRRVAARTLGEVRDDRSLDALIAALKDEDDKVRHWAARSLRHMGEPRGLAALEKAGVIEKTEKKEKKKAKKKSRGDGLAKVLTIGFALLLGAAFVAAAWQFLEARAHPGLSLGEDVGAFVAGGLLGLLFAVLGAMAPTLLPLAVIGWLLPSKDAAGGRALAKKDAEHAVQCLLWVAIFFALVALLELWLIDPEALQSYGDKTWQSRQTDDGTSWSNDAAFGLSIHIAEVILGLAAAILALVGTFLSFKALYKLGLNRTTAVVGGAAALTTVLGMILVPAVAKEISHDIERGWAVSHLDQGDSADRAKAAATLFAQGDRRAVPGLTKALEGSDRAARLEALDVLDTTCPDELLPTVAALIMSRDREVQEKALSVLEEIGPRGIVLLGVFHRHPEAWVRDRVARLFERKDPALDSHLIQALQRKETAIPAAFALGMRKSPVAVNALCGALGLKDRWHRDRVFRKAAVEALADIGDNRAIPTLAREAQNRHRDAATNEALSGLLRCKPWTDATYSALVAVALKRKKDDLSETAGKALIDHGGEKAVAPLVLRLGLADRRASGRAATILARLGKPAVPALRKAVKSQDNMRIAHAAFALGFADDARSLSDLLQLLDSRYSIVLEAAAGALQRRKDPRALPALAAKLDGRYVKPIVATYGKTAIPHLLPALKSTDRSVRKIAFELLAKNPDSRAIPHFVHGLADRHVRRMAAEGLVRIGKSAVPALLNAFEQGDKAMKYWASVALAGIDDPRKVEPLVRALGHESSLVRTGAAKALASVCDPDRLVEPLLLLLKDEAKEVRKAAIRALAAQKDSRSVEALIGVFSDRDWTIRRKASEALALVGEAALDPLAKVMTSRDSAKRWCALRALAIMKSPKAEPLMRRALRDPHKPVQKVAVAGLKAILWRPHALAEKVDWFIASESWTHLRKLNPSTTVVDMVMDRVKEGSKDDLADLVETLGVWRATRAAPLLLPLLEVRGGSLRVPVRAARALGRMGERRAIEPLIGLLSHRASIVRRAASEALTEITNELFGLNKAAWEEWWATERKKGK